MFGLPVLGCVLLRFLFGPCLLRVWFLLKDPLELCIILFHFLADIIVPDRKKKGRQQSRVKRVLLTQS